jgi:hypothetical protein
VTSRNVDIFGYSLGGSVSEMMNPVERELPPMPDLGTVRRMVRMVEAPALNAMGVPYEDIEWAANIGERLYPGEGLDGRGDAARHLALGALLSRTNDPEFAQKLGDAREILDPRGREMDKFNNRIGMQLSGTNEELERQIVNIIESGDAQFYNLDESMRRRGYQEGGIVSLQDLGMPTYENPAIFEDPLSRLTDPVSPELGPFQQIVPEEEGIRDVLERELAGALGDDRRDFRRAENLLLASEFLPVAGDVGLGVDVSDAFERGDTLEGGIMALLGSIPLVGGMARRGIKNLRISEKFDSGIPTEGQGHAIPSELLVKGAGEKATTPVVQKFTPQNTQKVMQSIDEVKIQNAQAMDTPENWLNMENQAFGGDFVPMPPLEAINYRNDPKLLAEKLKKLTPDLKAQVDEGFGYVQQLKNIYNSGQANPEMTGRLMLWGILSRGAGPAAQEAAFLDVVDAAKPYIQKAVAGEFTPRDLENWKKVASTFLPEGSPGKTVTNNVNDAGRLLQALSQRTGPNQQTALGRMHDLLSDPNVSGRQFRREFFELTDKPGIDNKVVSFIGLVSGKDDMLVMDRIQSRHLWDDGRFGGKNIYNGVPMGKAKTKSGLANILGGPRGLLLTESLEDGLNDSVRQAYEMVGRPQDASIGRMHWETWVIEGNQAVSHSTLQSVLRGTPIGGAVTEGKRGRFDSGAVYRMAVAGPIIEYPLSDGTKARMTPERFQEFIGVVKKPGTGIVPRQFKVSQATDRPWYESEGVDREKLDELARQYQDANPDGSLRSGAPRIIKGADTVSERRGNFLRALRVNRAASRVQGRADAGDTERQAGTYLRRVGSKTGSTRLLELDPDPEIVSQFEYAGLNAPAIRQVDASENAVSYNQAMIDSLAGDPTAPQVEIKSAEDLAQMRLFQTPSGSGFAIKPDGDIVAVYASPEEPRKGAYAMLEAAVEAGGRKLDAFDTYLPKIYETVGFRPVSKIAWDDEFAPPGWDKEVFKDSNNGEPDVIFFVYDPDYTGVGGSADLPYSADYDAAEAIQAAEVEKMRERVDEVLGPAKFKRGGSVGIQAIHTPSFFEANQVPIDDGIGALPTMRRGALDDPMESGIFRVR